MDCNGSGEVARCRRVVAGRRLGGAGARLGRCRPAAQSFHSRLEKIAAVAAVVAIAVLIGETVVNQGVVDGDRQTTFFAGELTTADGQLLYDDEPLRNEAPTALSEAPGAAGSEGSAGFGRKSAGCDRCGRRVGTDSLGRCGSGGAVVPKRDGSRSTVGCGTL